MAQVSRRRLAKDANARISDLFLLTLTSLSNKNKTLKFLDTLLSSTEKIMLSKRLAIAFMLYKGYDSRSIQEVLKVSGQTVWSVKNVLATADREFEIILNAIIKKEKREKFWNDFSDLIDRVVPPRPGVDWKRVRRKQWEARRKRQKPF